MVAAANFHRANSEPNETTIGLEDSGFNKGPKQHIGDILKPQNLANQAKDLAKDVQLEYKVPKAKTDFAFNYARNLSANQGRSRSDLLKKKKEEADKKSAQEEKKMKALANANRAPNQARVMPTIKKPQP